MTRTEVAIHDIASALANLRVSPEQRNAIFVQSLESLVRFAISEHETRHIREAQNDLARVAEIQEGSKKAL